MTSSSEVLPSARPRRRWTRFLWVLPILALVAGLVGVVIVYALASVPLPRQIKLPSAAEVFDRDGELIGIFAGEERRFTIDTRRLPPHVWRAVIAAEDRDFFEHQGVSPRAVIRAAWANLTGGQISQGGSTITQQYIKNAVLQDPSRTVERKAREAVLALKLERAFSKRQILGFYLNTIYLGRGAYGIEAAARSYFDKHATQLTLSEAAYLAGIIPAPESYQLDRRPRAAKERRERVLLQMENQGYITPGRMAEALRTKLKLAPSPAAGTQKAAYFMEWLRKDVLEPQLGARLYTSGLKIHTTLDLDMQAQAEAAVSSLLHKRSEPQAALVALTPKGSVRAMVGGRRYRNVEAARGFNFATDNRRQPGSAFKPFTLLSAIEQGISPMSRFPGSSPATISDPVCANPDGTPWQPENYGGASYGTITLDEATTNSVNTVYAQLIAEIGPGSVAGLLERFGFRGPSGEEVAARCSLALGGSDVDVSPLQMARAYAGFTARGTKPDVSPVLYVEDQDGDCLLEYGDQRKAGCGGAGPETGRRVVERNSADVLNQVLTHVVSGGTATAADIGRPTAGKTGTTQDNVDAWFAGSIPQLTTVVWMGYPRLENKDLVPQMRFCADPELCRPVQGIDVTGGSFPARIWAAFMAEAVAGTPVEEFAVPGDLPGEVLNSPPPPSPTPTPSPSPTPSPTPTPSPSFTPSPTPPPSPSPVPPPSPSPVPSPSPAPSPSLTPAPSPSPAASPDPAGGPGP
ncbi:MAG: transglycosylase domain-containing protein [Actinomycetota bacterium]|nr:transglycosylase domain-containing protein [Actinomycetota bacterium]